MNVATNLLSNCCEYPFIQCGSNLVSCNQFFEDPKDLRFVKPSKKEPEISNYLYLKIQVPITIFSVQGGDCGFKSRRGFEANNCLDNCLSDCPRGVMDNAPPSYEDSFLPKRQIWVLL
jgi:hypothetical protein